MVSRDNLQTYYILYSLFRDKMRCNLNIISKELNLCGRGQSKTTASKYVHRMYERQISLRPNLILRTFENSRLTAFFLKAKNPSEITTIFEDLRKDPNISYLLLLSGKYDFFVTTRYEKFHQGSKARIAKRVNLYTPLYTVPRGWNSNVTDVLRKQFAYSDPSKGKIERTVEDFLPWDQIHFDIYGTMMYNAQMPFTTAAKKFQMSSTTVKKYFYEIILPYCNTAHYFFPNGYKNYHKSMIILESDFEIGLVNLFSMLPCTTYIFPFEEEIGVIAFHEGVQELMFALKKLEERGYVRKYMLQVPLHWE